MSHHLEVRKVAMEAARQIAKQHVINFHPGKMVTTENFEDFTSSGSTPGSPGQGVLPWNTHPDEVVDGATSVPWVFTFAGTFANARASCGIAPTGGDATFDVTLNGLSILPSTVVIPNGMTLSADVMPTTVSFARNDVLQIVCGTANNVLDVIMYIDFMRL